MAQEASTRACPYCKEQINAEAVKCRYCGSRVSPERAAHGGICPFCKEKINPEATKCRYCGSMLNASAAPSDCGCDDSPGTMGRAGATRRRGTGMTISPGSTRGPSVVAQMAGYGGFGIENLCWEDEKCTLECIPWNGGCFWVKVCRPVIVCAFYGEMESAPE